MANEDIIVGEDLQDADVEMEDQSAKSAEEPSAVKVRLPLLTIVVFQMILEP